MENTIYTAYQDLQQYSNDDINLMAQYQDILYTTNVNDLRWLLAIKNTSRRAVMPNNLPEPAYIETLPPEMILQIFKNLDMVDILNACETNVLWSNICKDKVLWKKLYEKDFPVNYREEEILKKRLCDKVKDESYYNSYRVQAKRAKDIKEWRKYLNEHRGEHKSLKQLQVEFRESYRVQAKRAKDIKEWRKYLNKHRGEHKSLKQLQVEFREKQRLEK